MEPSEQDKTQKKKDKKKPDSNKPLLSQNAKTKQSSTPNILSGLNASTNMFSQLSQMYQQQKGVENPEGKEFKSFQDPSQEFERLLITKFEPDIQRILNSLSKKSEITKLKGLIELQEILKKKEEDFFDLFLPSWVFLYKQFITSEYDKKILEEVNNILLIIVQLAKKKISSQFKELFVYWFLSMNDPNSEVSSIANKAFELLFPLEKHNQALFVCSENFANNMKFFLRITIQTIMQENTTLIEGQAFEIYDRLIVSTLNAISRSLIMIKGHNKENEFIELIAKTLELDFLENKRIHIIEIIENKKRVKPRSGVLDLIHHIINYIPEELYINQKINIFKHVLLLIDDKERMIQQGLWRNCLVSVLKKCDDIVWKNLTEKIKDNFISKLLDCIKRCGFGIGNLFYNNIIVVLSLLPFANMHFKEDELKEEPLKNRIVFTKNFLDAIFFGINHDEIKFFSESLINSYFECLYFVILKRFSIFVKLPILDNYPNLKKYLKNVIKDLLKTPLYEYINNNITSNIMSVQKMIPIGFSEFFENVSSSDLNEIYYEEFFFELLSIHKNKCKNFINFENYFNILNAISKKINKDNIFLQKFGNIIIEINQDLFFLVGNEIINNNNNKIDDFLIEKNLGFIKIYHKFLNDIICEENYLNTVLIEKFLEIFSQIKLIFKELSLNFNNIYKFSVFEKYLWYISQIFNIWLGLFTSYNSNIFENEKYNIEIIINEIYLSILSELNLLKSFQLGFSNSYILLFSCFILDFSCNNSNFTDFLSINQNFNQCESLLTNLIQKKKTKNIYKNICVINNLNYQKIVLKIVDLFLMTRETTISIIPTIFNCFKYLCSEETILKILNLFKEFINNNCDFVYTKEKNLIIEKIQIIYLCVINWVLSDFSKNIHDKLIEFFEKFLVLLFKLYSIDIKGKIEFFYDLFKIMIKNKNLEEKLYGYFYDESNKILKTITKKSCNVKQLNNIIEFISDFLYFLKINNKNDQITIFFKTVLFNKDLFENSLSVKNIWSVLVNSIESVNDIIQYKELFRLEKSNFWLLSLMFSASNSFALLKELNLRKFLIDISNNHLMETIFELIESNISEKNQLFYEFLDYFIDQCNNFSLIYLNGLKNLLRQFSLNCYDEDKIQKTLIFLFNKFKTIVINVKVNINYAFIFKTLLFQFKEKIKNNETISQYINFFVDYYNKKINENLLNNINSNLDLIISLDFLLMFSFFRKDIFQNDDFIEKINSFIFKKISIENELDNEKNYFFAIIFEYISIIIEEKTFVAFSDYVLQIENLFKSCLISNKQIKKYYTKSLTNLTIFMRKVLSIIEAFTPGFKDFINENILITLFSILNRLIVDESIENENENLLIDEFNDQMITEFGETIIRFSSMISENFEENIIYELINTPFPSIQKSSFHLLNTFYQNNVPKSIDITNEIINKESDEIQQIYLKYIPNANFIPKCLLKNLSTDIFINFSNILHGLYHDSYLQDEQEEFKINLVNPSSYSYYLTWISLFLKLKSPINNSRNDSVKLAIKYYLETNIKLYTEFLNNSFACLKTINLHEIEGKKILANSDLSKIEPEWSDFLSIESLFKLIIQSLYLFSSEFPLFLRKWIENGDKKYTKMSDLFIKTYISNSLFLNEVDIIEMRQEEWKSDEFNIYIAKNTREINAIFCKEDSQLEINLKIPNDYPLREINIECERGVKIPESKITRWIMRMKSMLKNQNNSILNLLLIWKQNLDKEFEGVEECPICYYVIHSTTKELPKLSCKTCSHKFHSSCIHKWFNSSNKSECPLCKSQFL